MIILAAVVASHLVLAATPLEAQGQRLIHAQALFHEGRYREVLPIIDGVLGAAGLPDELRAEAYELQAFSLYLMSLFPQAQEAWRKLLAVAPEHRPDPVEVSPELLAFFARVQEQVEGEQRARAAAAPVPEPAGTTVVAAKPASEPARDTEVRAAATQAERGCGVLLCLMPFGIGQLANGEVGAGLAFGAAELAFLGVNVGLYWQRKLEYERHDRLRNPENAEASYIVQHVALGLFAATAVAGVVHAFWEP